MIDPTQIQIRQLSSTGSRKAPTDIQQKPPKMIAPTAA
jgi:hypothetical protein